MKNVELDSIKDGKIVVKGRELRVRWMDSYVIIWSGKEHPYEKNE